MKRNTHNHRGLIFLTSIAIAILSAAFLFEVLRYFSYSIELFMIECDAAEGTWTANGFVNWTDFLVNCYNEVLESRDAFVSSNDIGNFLYHCGFSTFGKLVRLVLIIATILLEIMSVTLSVAITKYYCKKIVSRNKRTSIRRVPCRYC